MSIDVSKINEGDSLSVMLTDGSKLSGLVKRDDIYGHDCLTLGPVIVRYWDGVTGAGITSIDSHTPGIPAHIRDADTFEDSHGRFWKWVPGEPEMVSTGTLRCSVDELWRSGPLIAYRIVDAEVVDDE